MCCGVAFARSAAAAVGGGSVREWGHRQTRATLQQPASGVCNQGHLVCCCKQLTTATASTTRADLLREPKPAAVAASTAIAAAVAGQGEVQAAAGAASATAAAAGCAAVQRAVACQPPG